MNTLHIAKVVKKGFIFTAACICSLPAWACPQFPDCPAVMDSVITGDLDGDGVLTLVDEMIAAQALDTIEILSCPQRLAMDVNADGFSDAADVEIIGAILEAGGDLSDLPGFGTAPGDADGDGFIRVTDLAALAALQSMPSGEDISGLDLNQDGVLDASDIVTLRHCLQGKVESVLPAY